jgi:hypothetical protein
MRSGGSGIVAGFRGRCPCFLLLGIKVPCMVSRYIRDEVQELKLQR